VTQRRIAVIHHQHSVKVLAGQIAAIECPMIAVCHLYLVKVLAGQIAATECTMIAACHLYHQMVRVLAGVLNPKSIGFAMIAQLRALLPPSLPQPNVQQPKVQQPNVQQAFMFLEKQPLLLLTYKPLTMTVDV
jgi:hypothetical protein